MADQDLREAFNDCIDRRAAGQSIADCLRRYPRYAAEIEPMLEVGSLIDRTQPPPYEISAAQARVRERISLRMVERPRRRSYSRLLPLAASLLLVLVVLLGMAENSLPGDALYGVKRFTENVSGALTGQQFTARRVDEIRALEALRRTANVEFSGQVEEIDGARWRVAELDIQVLPETQGAASIVVGDTVRARASTTDHGDLVASELTLLSSIPVPTATVASPVTPTALPTSTPAPTACTPTMPSAWVRYAVKPGDTVSGLAALSGVSVDELIALNCLPQSRMIIAGQTLFLPFLPTSTPTLTPTFLSPTWTQVSAGSPPRVTAAPTSDEGSDDDDRHGENDG